MYTSIHAALVVLLLLTSILAVTPNCVERCKARFKMNRWNNCIHNYCIYKKRGFPSLSERHITDSTVQSHPDRPTHCILDNMWNDLSKSSQEFILKVFDNELNLENLSKE